MSKASIETDLRDYSEIRNANEIVFTDIDELTKYNQKLLNEFLKYLDIRQKKTRDVVYVGVSVAFIPNEEFASDFLNKITLK